MSSFNKVVAVCALLMLVGCSSGRSYQTGMLDTVKLIVSGGEGYEADPEQIARIPYASILASIEGGPQGLLILSGVDGAKRRWTSADGVSLIVSHGRLQQIANWRKLEITGFRSEMPDPLPSMIRTKQAHFQYRIDLIPGYRENVVVNAVLTQVGREQVNILGIERELLHVEEEVASEDLDFKATNHYWLDPQTAAVWKSVQFPAPGMGAVQMNQAKPYRGGS